MSLDTTVHYSFDMAQQVTIIYLTSHPVLCMFSKVHYPSNPMQPGPVYFLTPRKCAIFGISCEAIPRQVMQQWYNCYLKVERISEDAYTS